MTFTENIFSFPSVKISFIFWVMISVVQTYLFILLQQMPATQIKTYLLHFFKLGKARKFFASNAFGTEFIIQEPFCDAATYSEHKAWSVCLKFSLVYSTYVLAEGIKFQYVTKVQPKHWEPETESNFSAWHYLICGVLCSTKHSSLEMRNLKLQLLKA